MLRRKGGFWTSGVGEEGDKVREEEEDSKGEEESTRRRWALVD